MSAALMSDAEAAVVVPEPPDDLGAAGTELWMTATMGRTFTPAQLLMLKSAAQFADLASAARATVLRRGPTTCSRYHGERPHPAAQLAIRYAVESRKLLSRLKVWI
jgi:hypothetical protein